MSDLKHIHDFLFSLAELASDPSAQEAPNFEERLQGKLIALLNYLYAHEMYDLMEAIPDLPIPSERVVQFLEVLQDFIIPEAARRLKVKAGTDWLRWNHLHPKIVTAAKNRLETGHLADAVEAAFKELNSTVKSLVLEKTGQELDGARLMTRAFSVENPVLRLADLSSESGRSEQIGYMQIFAGAMTGIRNPKAHSNIVIDELRAIHLLYLASLLMFKLDQRVQDSESTQNPPLHRTTNAAGEG